MLVASHTSVLGPPILKLESSWRRDGPEHNSRPPCSGVNGDWLLPFTPIFLLDQNLHAINDELHRQRRKNDAE